MKRHNVLKLIGCLALAVVIVSCAGKKKLRPPTGDPAAEDSFSADYVLGPEDLIEVLVWKNEGLSKTVMVRPDGKISLPLMGELQAGGLTAVQLRDAIKERLKEYKETPEVSIIVKEINSFSIYVMGEVAHPGKLQLRSDITFLQALTLAGGFTKFADADKIILLRREGKQETRMRINYKDIVSGKNPDGNILLRRGDTIVVP